MNEEWNGLGLAVGTADDAEGAKFSALSLGSASPAVRGLPKFSQAGFVAGAGLEGVGLGQGGLELEIKATDL